MFKFNISDYDLGKIENMIAKEFDLGEVKSSNLPVVFTSNIDDEVVISGTKKSKRFLITIIKKDNSYSISVE